jgi:ABC-type oligopeptide transport system ATPase subunit
MVEQDTLLSVENLKMHFPIYAGLIRRVVNAVRAVDDVSFSIRRGETLGLVGESGCGKTTVGRCIARAYQPTAGRILFAPRNDGGSQGQPVDLARIDRSQLKQYRRNIQMIFQDPYSSLNPRMTVFDIVADPLRIHHILSGKALEDRVVDLLDRVG